jgi:hypothetical protein
MSGRQPWVQAQKGHKSLSDRWITLKFLQGFREAVFRGIYTECLLSDKDVWSTEQEHRLKRAITFGPTVGSHSNFCMGFQWLFSLGKLWNRWVIRMSGRQPWVSAQKGNNFWSDRLIALKILLWFSEGCFHWGSCGIAVQWRGCLVPTLEYRLKRAITFDPTVWSLLKFYCGFQRLFLFG